MAHQQHTIPGSNDWSRLLDLELHHVKKRCQHVLSTVYRAGHAYGQSWRNPTVLKTLRSVSKTIVLTAAVQYLLFLLLLWPLDLIVALLGWLLRTGWDLPLLATAQGAMVLYPLITLRVIKLVYRKHLEECSTAALQQPDHPGAGWLGHQHPAAGAAGPSTSLRQLLHTLVEPGDDPMLMFLLPVLPPLLRRWRSMPYVGVVLGPAAQFFSIRYLVGRPWAAAGLTVAASLLPAAQPSVMRFVELWASAKMLASSSMRHLLGSNLPADKRGAFIRTHEYMVVCYYLLPTWTMQLPLVGALAAFPAAAVAAYLLKDITGSWQQRDSAAADSSVELGMSRLQGAGMPGDSVVGKAPAMATVAQTLAAAKGAAQQQHAPRPVIGMPAAATLKTE